MKTTPSRHFLLALLMAGHAAIAENPIPEPWTAERYAAISRQSPFALATPAAPVSAPQASFAANWYVEGIARIGEADFVTIKSRDLSTQFSLFGHEPDPRSGVVLSGVDWSETVGKSTVTVRKGNEVARLEFNEATLRSPAPPGGKGTGGEREPQEPKNAGAGVNGMGRRVPLPSPVPPRNAPFKRRIQPIGTPP